MAVHYLFNSSGFWIAYREDRYIFDPSGNWVGWLPFDDGEVINAKGVYLGHVLAGDRFYRKDAKYLTNRVPHTVPDVPRYRVIPEPPAPIGRAPLPIGCHDLRLSAHV